MVLLPEGFSLPPVPYLLGLSVALLAVGFGLYRRRPPVTARHILAMTPWIILGSSMHVLYVVDALPPVVAPLGGTAAVYLTVAAAVGAVWLLAAELLSPSRVPTALAATGVLALLPIVGGALAVGAQRGTLALFWPAVGAALTAVATVIAWGVLRRVRPEAVAVTGWAGLLALCGHTLDAVSTAVGVDVLGFGERTPLSAVILDVAAALPTAEVLGSGWLFVLIKVLLVGGVVVLFADYVEETPAEGYLLLGVIAAVGLGPGAHNLLLFAVTAGAT